MRCLKESPVNEPLPRGKAESLGQERWEFPAEKDGRDSGPLKRNNKIYQHMRTRSFQAGVNPWGLGGPTSTLQIAGNCAQQVLCHKEGNIFGAGTDRPEQAFLIQPESDGRIRFQRIR